MSFLGKEYVSYKHENFDGFLRSIDYSEDNINTVVAFKRKIKIVKDGDIYKLNGENTEGTKEITFQSGVEFDDHIGINKNPVKITYVVNGDKVIQTIKSPRSIITFNYDYSGDELIATITSDKWDGVAKIYHKA